MNMIVRVEKYLSKSSNEIVEAVSQKTAILSLPFAERSKSRLRAETTDGQALAIFLPRGTVLRDGDVLVAENGSLIKVEAAAESVLQIHAQSAIDLLRAAYHLGNRHTPVQVGCDFLRIAADAVLEDMLKQLGVQVAHANMPFEPESGAYGGGHHHGHDETFAEDYALAQKVFKYHEHAHPHPHPHAHPHKNDAS